jgi:hypothetical protein
MTNRRTIPILLLCAAIWIGGCDLAPAPAPTTVPTITPSPEPEATVTPTFGPLVYINRVYCWLSPVDDGEFNLLRFFDDGTVLDATVQPFTSCDEAWREMAAFMTLDRRMDFGHGVYEMSGDRILFELSAPNSTTIVGTATGEFKPGLLVLTKGGAIQEYILVDGQ